MPRETLAAVQVEQWVSVVCTTLDPLWLRQYYASYVLTARAGRDPDRARIEECIPKMAPQFAVMDRAVAMSGHLVGDTFTLADAYLIPILFYMNAVPESRALLGESPRLSAYFDRHIGRKTVQQTKPEFLVHEMRR